MIFEKIELLFLEALKASLNNTRVNWEVEISQDEWKRLFQLSEIHNVLPMIYEAVYSCHAISTCDRALMLQNKRMVLMQVMTQTMKSAEFLALFKNLKDAGIRPCVVKGIVCRSIYPNPDHRISNDEDVFIPEEQFEMCHKEMLAQGMVLAIPNQNIYDDYEVSYRKPGSNLYIEIHKHLFAPDEAAYSEFNGYFDGIHDKLISMDIENYSVDSMPHTEHLFFLICHAFKHFLHGGFGIRQVCDILLYARTFSEKIDWKKIFENSCNIAAQQFVASMIVIGDKYLGLPKEDYQLTQQWKELLTIDESMMLKDLLDSGIFGNSESARKRSSGITIAALAAQKKGKKEKSSLASSLFPPITSLKGRYKYLEHHRWLIPLAWLSRIISYGIRKKSLSDNVSDSGEIIRIGNERVELMRKYGIIK